MNEEIFLVLFFTTILIWAVLFVMNSSYMNVSSCLHILNILAEMVTVVSMVRTYVLLLPYSSGLDS